METAPAALENVEAALHEEVWVKHRRRTIALIVLTVLIEIALIAFIYGVGGLEAFISDATLMLLALPAIVLLGLPYAAVRNRLERTFLAQMAASLGFSYEPSMKRDRPDAQLFRIGHSPSFSHVFSGSVDGREAFMYTYSYTVGSGRNSTTYHARVWELECGVTLLPLLVKPRRMGSMGGSLKPSGTVPLKLEGDFNEHFEVFAADQMEIEAFTVLEPAFMARLIDHYGDYGFECAGTKLYVFTAKRIPLTRSAFLDVFALVEKLHTELVPKLHDVSDEVAALRAAYGNTRAR